MRAGDGPTVADNQRVRVLHVGKFYPPSRGGMEKVVQVLCEAERGLVDSQVLVSNDGPTTIRESVQGVPVTRVAAWTKVGSVTVCPMLPVWMRRLKSDVMVIHEPNPIALVAHALARPKGKLVVWFHAEVVRPQWRYKAFYRPFLRRVLRHADRIIVASPQVAEYAEELKDFRKKCVSSPTGFIFFNRRRLPSRSSAASRRFARTARRLSCSCAVRCFGRMMPLADKGKGSTCCCARSRTWTRAPSWSETDHRRQSLRSLSLLLAATPRELLGAGPVRGRSRSD